MSDASACKQALDALSSDVEIVPIQTFTPGQEAEVEIDAGNVADWSAILPKDGTAFVMFDGDVPVAISFRKDRVWYSIVEHVEATDDDMAQAVAAKSQQHDRTNKIIVESVLKTAPAETREAYELWSTNPDDFEEQVLQYALAQVDAKNLQEGAYGIVRKAPLLRALRHGNAAAYLLPDRWDTLRAIEERVNVEVGNQVEANRKAAFDYLLSELPRWLATNGNPDVKRPTLKMFLEAKGYTGNQNDLDELKTRFELEARASVS